MAIGSASVSHLRSLRQIFWSIFSVNHARARAHTETKSVIKMSVSLTSRYRVSYLVVHLGWVNFDLGCSTACQFLPGMWWDLAKVARRLGIVAR